MVLIIPGNVRRQRGQSFTDGQRLRCFMFGIGATDMADVPAAGEMVRVPETIR